MGCNMNWEAVGAIGEIIAALAVLVTLAFLAYQLKEFSKSNNAATVGSYMQSYGAAMSRVGSSTEVARIVRLGDNEPESLSEDEHYQYIYHAGEFFTLWEGLWRMKVAGLISPDHWTTIREDIVAFLVTPGGKLFLKQMLPLFNKNMPEFAKELESCLNAEPTYTLATQDEPFNT